MKTFWKIFFGSFLALVAAGLLMAILCISFIGTLAAGAGTKAEPLRGEAILVLDFAAPVSERPSETFQWSPAGGAGYSATVSLYDYVKAIDRAATDPAIKFIYMTPEQPALSLSQSEEIRSALQRFRAAGKAVVSYSNRMTDGGYYLASVADKVMMNSYGDAMMLGLSSSMIFFKDALDRLGINVQLIRHGKYKSAGETFVKNTISPENREQNEAMIRSMWNRMVSDICASRDFDPQRYNAWVDHLELTHAADLLERGLVDELCYETDVRQYLCALCGVEAPDDLRMVDINRYATLKPRKVPRRPDKIAVVYCDGDIVVDGAQGTVSGEQTARILADLRKDDAVKAVVLRVNSPGGDALAAEIINRELGLLKEEKPVVASYGSYAASGGYWISARADRIFTTATTLTGSIGVFSLIPDFGDALRKKVGVNVISINSNRHSAALSMMQPLQPGEVESMRRMVEKVYTDFTELVADGRHLSTEQVDRLGQGRVWTGEDAVRIGLADEIGGLVDAISYAAFAAGLDESECRIVSYPPVRSFAQRLAESFSKTRTSIEALGDPLSTLAKSYESLRSETGGRVYARLPYLYRFN